jgi:hypothetical protein
MEMGAAPKSLDAEESRKAGKGQARGKAAATEGLEGNDARTRDGAKHLGSLQLSAGDKALVGSHSALTYH